MFVVRAIFFDGRRRQANVLVPSGSKFMVKLEKQPEKISHWVADAVLVCFGIVMFFVSPAVQSTVAGKTSDELVAMFIAVITVVHGGDRTDDLDHWYL